MLALSCEILPKIRSEMNQNASDLGRGVLFRPKIVGKPSANVFPVISTWLNSYCVYEMPQQPP